MPDSLPQVRLHDSLTRRPQVLEPLLPGRVSIYTCGSTVYKYTHIGNLRTALRDELAALGVEVRDTADGQLASLRRSANAGDHQKTPAP